jgi:hypothetical protein
MQGKNGRKSMANPEVVVSEFEPFFAGAEAAIVSGPDVERSCEVLGTHPPFREPSELGEMEFDDVAHARSLALSASGVSRVAQEVGRVERSTELVVFSKSGALALRNLDSVEARSSIVSLISLLDQGNHAAACLPRTVSIGM